MRQSLDRLRVYLPKSGDGDIGSGDSGGGGDDIGCDDGDSSTDDGILVAPSRADRPVSASRVPLVIQA